jgi:hypothetical protein
MPNRYDPTFSGLNALLQGSNIQNGTQVSFVSGGGPATVLEAALDIHNNGEGETVFHNLQPEDRATIPVFKDGFKPADLKAFNTARKTSNYILPNGYEPTPGSIPRGGSVPQVRGFFGGEALDGAMEEVLDRQSIGTALPQGATLANILSGRPTVKIGSSK